MVLFFLFFFFKQKTAYEMRISDWSSDVCSSDLHPAARKTRRPLCRGGSVDQHPAEAAGRMASPVLGARSRSRHRRGADAQLRISRRYRRRRIARLALALGGGEEQPALCAADQQSRHHARSEEHTSELPSLMRNSYAVFCL